jgi:hypothetical protein
MDESENPEDISNVVHSPKDMAYELVEELEDGDRRRAQILAGRIQEMLLDGEIRRTESQCYRGDGRSVG